MRLLNTILSKNIVWSIILLLAVKVMFSQRATVPNSNDQLERPQMNLTTLLSRGNINSSFILYSTSSFEDVKYDSVLTQIKSNFVQPHVHDSDFIHAQENNDYIIHPCDQIKSNLAQTPHTVRV